MTGAPLWDVPGAPLWGLSGAPFWGVTGAPLCGATGAPLWGVRRRRGAEQASRRAQGRSRRVAGERWQTRGGGKDTENLALRALELQRRLAERHAHRAAPFACRESPGRGAATA